ncbi:MAG: sigma-54 dependent transcriptional regulator [Alphaproteobacteria bacterium]|nr:sigma-54 dependent transcriptional regulator [Alphaproteobacteria bacterium]
MAAEILVVDDEADIRELVGGILEDEGYTVKTAGNSADTLAAVRTRAPKLVVLDVWLKGSELDGLEILSILKQMDPLLPVVVISGHGTVETAVTAIRRGAYDYLEKPFQAEKLILTVQRALENAALKRENSHLRAKSATSTEIVGGSSIMTQLSGSIDKVAPTNSRILISGPPGAGKELVARLIHERSNRAAGPFVIVSAANMDPDRVEVELFGEEAPDGRALKIGLFEQAHNGTLLLDEISDMPLGAQSKILRVLVDQRFRRRNGRDDVSVDVRVVTTSARDLREEIATGRFREDLYYRLNVVPVEVPALDRRREDIAELVHYFVRRVADATGLQPRPFSEDAIAVLQASEWPGNVRQLRNVVERLLILTNGEPAGPITAAHLPSDASGDAGAAGSMQMISMSLRDAREHFEREYLAMQITRFGGNVSRTAAFIGMERSALHRKLKALGVDTSLGQKESQT